MSKDEHVRYTLEGWKTDDSFTRLKQMINVNLIVYFFNKKTNYCFNPFKVSLILTQEQTKPAEIFNDFMHLKIGGRQFDRVFLRYGH